MSTMQIKFNDYDFTDTLESWHEGLPSDIQTEPSLDRDGVLIGESAYLGPKVIRVSGMFAGVNPSALRTSVDEMASAFKSGRQQLNLFDDRYTYARNSAFDYNFAEDSGMNFAMYSAEFIADDPFWVSETLGTSTVTDATNSSLDVVNGGNAAAHPVITVTAQNETTYLKLMNDTSGDFFEYNNTLGIGDTLEVDCLARTVKKNGNNDIGNFTDDFFALNTGTNVISYTGPTNEVQVAWRDRWY